MARKKTFTQDELYQATHDLMLAVGYDSFSFQLLSKELDVSRTALYKYYGNKADLLRDYLNQQMEEIVERLSTAEWPLEYQAKLSHLLDIVFDYADTHRISNMVPAQKWTKATEDSPDVQRSKELHIQFFTFIQGMIEEGQADGFLDQTIPPMIMVESIFHSITLPNRSGLSANERVHYLKKMLFDGIASRK
ncbi:TetR/AcrR family transcriptional regulator [Fundicoccus sp. Sow4_D5]|uniref:TetR/AcrR family transcriptional regulator n=1 Tax=Fundicoccus sp. Sow4_D5 TaxID=3438782 RepID=UPI003F9043F0